MADNFYSSYPVEGGGTGVTSLDGLTGALTLVAGTGISIADGVSTITISSTSSGDVTLTNVGAVPNAKGASLSGQALTLQPANTSFPGVLLAADWNTFNNKQAALTLTDLTDAGTDGITITNGTGAVIGASPVTISQHVADTTHNGYLSSTDWNTFNGKQASGNYITALTGDVTASGPGSVAATVAKIQGTTVSGTTGSTNVVFSNSPTITGSLGAALDLGSHKITSVTDPVGAQDAATKAYVDAAVAALQPATAVFAASTTNIAGSYLNGVAGVGATFTTTATGVFTIDGVTPALNARILIKDQSSGFQNGIYTITTLGALGISTVFTRALDYNTASDMNSAGLIPVINGTANALSSWQQTAVITTVGTDSLIFQEFTANPSLYLLKANNLNDVASSSSSFNNLSGLTTLGDIIYGGASGTRSRLAGNTTTTPAFLKSLGSGGLATAPTFTQVAFSDLSGSVAAAQMPALTGDITSSAGTVATTYSGTVPLNKGGTGQTTKAAAFDALQPMTTGGDIIYGGASGTGTRLANGSSTQVLTSNGGTAAPSWAAVPFGNYAVSAVKTSTYAVLTTDNIVLVDGTSAFTATLPTAVGVTGKVYTIKRVDQTLANAVTIATTSSQTIDGVTTRKLMTQYEQFTVTSDGANWQILDHSYPSGWTAYTPTYTGFGTVSTTAMYWKRVGDSVLLRGKFTSGTPTAVEARLSLPSGLTSASTITGVEHADFGVAATGASTTFFQLMTDMEASVAYITFGLQTSTTSGLTKANGNVVAVNTQVQSIHASVPIANWEA